MYVYSSDLVKQLILVHCNNNLKVCITVKANIPDHHSAITQAQLSKCFTYNLSEYNFIIGTFTYICAFCVSMHVDHCE